MYKAYHELECDELEIISNGVMKFLSNQLLLDKKGWIFLDTIHLLSTVPELMKFFKKLELYPMEASVTILRDNFSIHVDTLPVVAKINIPIQNTKGWINRWYQIDTDILSKCPDIVDHLGFTKKDVSREIDHMSLIAELADQAKPIVFNSAYPHSVIKVNPVELPRIVLSVTFRNEPIGLLK